MLRLNQLMTSAPGADVFTNFRELSTLKDVYDIISRCRKYLARNYLSRRLRTFFLGRRSSDVGHDQSGVRLTHLLERRHRRRRRDRLDDVTLALRR